MSSNSFRSTARVKTHNPGIRPPFLPAAERTDTQNRSWPVSHRAPCTSFRNWSLFSRHTTTGTRNYMKRVWCSPSTVPRRAVPICCCVPKERVTTRNRSNYTRFSRAPRAATMTKAAGSGRAIRPMHCNQELLRSTGTSCGWRASHYSVLGTVPHVCVACRAIACTLDMNQGHFMGKDAVHETDL